MPSNQVGRERVAEGRREHHIGGVGWLQRRDVVEGLGGQSPNVGVPVSQSILPEAVDQMASVPEFWWATGGVGKYRY